MFLVADPGAVSYPPPDDGRVPVLVQLESRKPVRSTPASGCRLARRARFERPEPLKPPGLLLRPRRSVHSCTHPASGYFVLTTPAR